MNIRRCRKMSITVQFLFIIFSIFCKGNLQDGGGNLGTCCVGLFFLYFVRDIYKTVVGIYLLCGLIFSIFC